MPWPSLRKPTAASCSPRQSHWRTACLVRKIGVPGRCGASGLPPRGPQPVCIPMGHSAKVAVCCHILQASRRQVASFAASWAYINSLKCRMVRSQPCIAGTSQEQIDCCAMHNTRINLPQIPDICISMYHAHDHYLMD